jgi:hemerythrin-like metal-binding protein
VIKWDPETHGVGIRELDEQHQRLADLINRIGQAIASGDDPDSLRSLLDVLVQFSEFHFFTEEHYMAQHGYHGEASHRQGHHHLVDQLLTLRQDIATKDKADAQHIIDFLGYWLTQHILEMDRPLGYWLRAKGVK